MRFGDVVQINPEAVRSGYPYSEIDYIDISSVGTATLDGVTRYKLSDAPSRAKRIVRHGDTILATVRPNLRSFYYVKHPVQNTVVSTGFAVLRATDKIDSRFLYYIVTNQSFTDYLTVNSKGSAYPAVDSETIQRAEVELPTIEIQRRISSILSSYDDLIENNSRRIAVLEEMARRLYEEWFVHFRFPGYEQVRMVESELGLIPTGWNVVKLGNLVSEIRDSVAPATVDSDTPYVGLEHIPRRSIALGEWGRVADVQSSKLRFLKGDILFGKIRPYFHKVAVAPVDGVASSDAIVIRPNSADVFVPALATINSDAFVAHATQTSNGTKMPRANWTVLTEYPVLLPPSELRRHHHELVTNSVSSIQNLVMRNRNLRAQRDLLLPKLISGEIDVSIFPEAEAVAA